MKYVFTLLLLIASPLWAELGTGNQSAGAQGTLYVLVDQTATIYINGVDVKLSKEDGTAPVELNAGDRLVVKISSTHYYRHLALLFVSDSKQTMISFRTAYFKMLPDPQMTDFTEAQFNDFPKAAIPIDRLLKPEYVAKIMKKPFPFRNNSEFFWGDRQDCTVGALISADMFSSMAP